MDEYVGVFGVGASLISGQHMTEVKWLTESKPVSMMEFLGDKAGGRKLRLLSVACCRRVEALAPDELSRAALVIVERYADCAATTGELAAARIMASNSGGPTKAPGPDALPSVAGAWYAAKSIWHATEEQTSTFSMRTACHAVMNAAWAAAGSFGQEVKESALTEYAAQATLIRDIFGNPFRPIAFDPVWRSSNVTDIAGQMYDSRDFSPMPILADAL